jgi:hypothetical protein
VEVIETGESLAAALPFCFKAGAGRRAMERKRVGGRFVRAGLDEDGGAGASESKGVVAPRPAYCRSFTRARVAEALPEIVERFVEEAKKGSIAHAKLLTNLGGLDKGDMPTAKKREGKSSVRLLMEHMSKVSDD